MDEFATGLKAILKIVDTWKETTDKGTITVFELKVANKRTEIQSRLHEVGIQRTSRTTL